MPQVMQMRSFGPKSTVNNFGEFRQETSSFSFCINWSSFSLPSCRFLLLPSPALDGGHVCPSSLSTFPPSALAGHSFRASLTMSGVASPWSFPSLTGHPSSSEPAEVTQQMQRARNTLVLVFLVIYVEFFL